MKTISIAADFSKIPGVRYPADGPYSGEDFRVKILKPAVLALKAGEVLLIDLDDVEGYPVSFLEEAFGGLAREGDIGIERALAVLRFKSEDAPLRVAQIQTYIRDANTDRWKRR